MNYLHWHLGLGDALAFADLAVKIADGDDLVVPCWYRNTESVRSIFVNHPNIDVMPVADEDGMINPAYRDMQFVKLGHYSGIPRNEGEDLIEWVHRTAGVVHEFRFDYGVVAKACIAAPKTHASLIPAGSVIIHQDASRGFVIDRHVPVCKPEYVMNAGGTILSWAKAIEAAAEIHCIDSALLHLVEQLQPTGKLFYHKYARSGSESYNCLRHNWTVIE